LIAGICNWYNQLSDNGVVVVASGGKLSEGMKMAGQLSGDVPIAQRFLDDLGTQGVPHAAFGPRRPITPGMYTNLAIRKVPGTKLVSRAHLVHSDIQYGYRTAYYERGLAGPVVELVAADQ
jgi:hypothetical protein